MVRFDAAQNHFFIPITFDSVKHDREDVRELAGALAASWVAVAWGGVSRRAALCELGCSGVARGILAKRLFAR